ncbi:HAD-IB family hydrolase [Kitasatospora sp. NPDC049258]|uniref:HAD family hydrolase n=1 Tax=Kitasatospora sp. NPDC049258 TaxID=3155394 RepID=UPI003432B022
MPRHAAFLDVDQTLIHGVSLFRFLAYDLRASGAAEGAYDAAMAHNRRLKAAGISREQVNREFFRQFGGRSVAELADRGERWWQQEERQGGLLDRAVLAAVDGHRAAGDLVVLVSGSFPPCLDPIARRVGADAVLCTRPATGAGRYTGAVPRPMIGAEKARAIEELAASLAVDLAGSHAYGDHPSDLPMLAAVGHPVVVGDDPRMRREAAARGWTVLAAAPAPVPAPAAVPAPAPVPAPHPAPVPARPERHVAQERFEPWQRR